MQKAIEDQKNADGIVIKNVASRTDDFENEEAQYQIDQNLAEIDIVQAKETKVNP